MGDDVEKVDGAGDRRSQAVRRKPRYLTDTGAPLRERPPVVLLAPPQRGDNTAAGDRDERPVLLVSNYGCHGCLHTIGSRSASPSPHRGPTAVTTMRSTELASSETEFSPTSARDTRRARKARAASAMPAGKCASTEWPSRFP